MTLIFQYWKTSFPPFKTPMFSESLTQTHERVVSFSVNMIPSNFLSWAHYFVCFHYCSIDWIILWLLINFLVENTSFTRIGGTSRCCNYSRLTLILILTLAKCFQILKMYEYKTPPHLYPTTKSIKFIIPCNCIS